MSGDLEFKRSQVKCSDLISAGAIVIGPPVRRIQCSVSRGDRVGSCNRGTKLDNKYWMVGLISHYSHSIHKKNTKQKSLKIRAHNEPSAKY